MLSVVVPVYNEAGGLKHFYETLLKNLPAKYEIIFCDDGSQDDTPNVLRHIAQNDPAVHVIRLSRNFGKEAALTAGIAQATGDAILTIDADGQHPPKLIPEFISKWRGGAKVVVGVRQDTASETLVRRAGSRLFYKLFNLVGNDQMTPGSTDFRLIDKQVQKAFLRLSESDRITRGLIDWLGFERDYVEFTAQERHAGQASYSGPQLLRLASNSIVSLSPQPLYFPGIMGLIITPLSLLLGLSVLIEQILMGDPLHWRFTGTAMLGILIIFLVGIVLVSIGILSLYLSHVHNQSKNRPLFIVEKEY